MPGPVLRLASEPLYGLYRRYAETGMGFQIALASLRPGIRTLCLITSDARVLPFVSGDLRWFGVDDWITGEIPREAPEEVISELPVETVFSARHLALAALSDVDLPPGYLPSRGAIQLLGSITMPSSSVFYRFVWAPADPSYQNGTLLPGTYLTSHLDYPLATTGFGAVGRYALPIPAPAVHLFQYELPAGSVLRVGTIAPMFGQAGGGVEVKLDRLPKSAVVRQLGHMILSAY